MLAPSGAGFLLRRFLQPAQVASPHLPQDRLERAQSPAVNPGVTLGSLAAVDEEARVLEDAKVLGDGRPADIGGRGDLAPRPLRVPAQPQDLAPPRVGDSLHGVFASDRAGSSSHLHYRL